MIFLEDLMRRNAVQKMEAARKKLEFERRQQVMSAGVTIIVSQYNQSIYLAMNGAYKP